MASATADIETKKIIHGVTLTLDNDEATALLDLLARVGGDPAKSRRGLLDGVNWALESAGVERLNSYRKPGDLAGAGIYFHDIEEDTNK